ncbi:hypothetical protein [Cellvibrio sp. PSBB023]|uniref:hypothetical protein n=1 Tax=Cellvibrio sp. PSBB023 TaxID=1945512 RepID=UPI00098F02A1|nr:hypothetical protein [Cellvibrio sp. PSBB023]AQT59181.1 hypothetical protein B0D95_03075 [Cellvibrio sp. PSBB023]
MQKTNVFFLSALIFLGISIITVAFLINKIQLQYSDFSITTPSGNTSKIDFPVHKQSQESGIYKLEGIAYKNSISSTKLQIIPDDEISSLSINNNLVDISHIPESGRRDYRNGFILDLKDHLKNGENKIEIIFSDTGGMMGINLKSLYAENLNKLMIALMGLTISLLILKARLSFAFKILLIAALFIRLFYFSITPPDTRTHDQEEHLEYSEYLAVHWLPPALEKATDGAYFHPPLYYYTGAIVLKITRAFGPISNQEAQRIQQLLCLAYSMGFVYFGLLLIKQFLNITHSPPASSVPLQATIASVPVRRSKEYGKHLNSKFIQLLSANKKPEPALSSCAATKTWAITEQHLFIVIGAMFVLWPSSVIHSVRIGNDPLLYFLFAAGTYYIARWFSSDGKRDLLIASILTALTTLTKANGEILIAVIGVIGLAKMIKSREWVYYLKLAIVPGLIVLLSLAITVGPGLLLKLQGKRDQLYIDNINNVSSALRVGNAAQNFVWFDMKTFITEPFTSPWEDEKGRQYFMNYQGKTGLFGEFGYSSMLAKNAAVISSLLAVLMSTYILFGLYHMQREEFKRQTVILLTGLLLVAGVTYMRMTFPVNIDFRYILPILIPYCILYASSITNFHRIGAVRLANIGLLIAIIFIISNFFFILGI